MDYLLPSCCCLLFPAFCSTSLYIWPFLCGILSTLVSVVISCWRPVWSLCDAGWDSYERRERSSLGTSHDINTTWRGGGDGQIKSGKCTGNWSSSKPFSLRGGDTMMVWELTRSSLYPARISQRQSGHEPTRLEGWFINRQKFNYFSRCLLFG